jgi:hypothetical protein
MSAWKMIIIYVFNLDNARRDLKSTLRWFPSRRAGQQLLIGSRCIGCLYKGGWEVCNDERKPC